MGPPYRPRRRAGSERTIRRVTKQSSLLGHSARCSCSAMYSVLSTVRSQSIGKMVTAQAAQGVIDEQAMTQFGPRQPARARRYASIASEILVKALPIRLRRVSPSGACTRGSPRAQDVSSATRSLRSALRSPAGSFRDIHSEVAARSASDMSSPFRAGPSWSLRVDTPGCAVAGSLRLDAAQGSSSVASIAGPS